MGYSGRSVKKIIDGHSSTPYVFGISEYEIVEMVPDTEVHQIWVEK